MRNRIAYISLEMIALAVFAACGDVESPEESHTHDALTFQDHVNICQVDVRVTAGILPLDVCVGGDIFFRETFDGNGRTCGSCHPVNHNLTIDPAFIATLRANDPLFIAENDPTLADLERPTEMRNRGLILENVDGTQPGGPNVRFVLRAVPHTLSMGVTVNATGLVNPPNERTGWSGDGAPGLGRLIEFTNGAITQHFTRTLNRVPGTDFREATADEGDRVAVFMRASGRTNDVNLGAITFSDTAADQGRLKFLDAGCGKCHVDAGTGSPNDNFDTGVEASRNTGLASFPIDGGFLTTPANADGSFGDKTFNTPSLIEAADTGPFFHTDTTISGSAGQDATTASTIEQAIAFYSTPAFASSPSGGGSPLPINATDVVNIGRFLRATNAVFNIQIALKRAIAARTLGSGVTTRAVQVRLINLARVEVEDAIAVLRGAQGGSLNSAEITRLDTARTHLINAAKGSITPIGMNPLQLAINQLDLADGGISAALSFTIGSGALMD